MSVTKQGSTSEVAMFERLRGEESQIEISAEKVPQTEERRSLATV
jgi:hypothetical protein